MRLGRASFTRLLELPVSASLKTDIVGNDAQQLLASYDKPADDRRLEQPRLIHPDPIPHYEAFIEGIVTNLPSLRSFAVSLTRSVDQADDLVQETVLRAISKQGLFEPGTNLRAWLFAILRNLFCSACRRAKHEVEDADGSYAATLISIPDHENRAMLRDLAAALDKLPEGQRKAIMLVGAEGMSYEAAAQSLGCAIGTI